MWAGVWFAVGSDPRMPLRRRLRPYQHPLHCSAGPIAPAGAPHLRCTPTGCPPSARCAPALRPGRGRPPGLQPTRGNGKTAPTWLSASCMLGLRPNHPPPASTRTCSSGSHKAPHGVLGSSAGGRLRERWQRRVGGGGGRASAAGRAQVRLSRVAGLAAAALEAWVGPPRASSPWTHQAFRLRSGSL